MSYEPACPGLELSAKLDVPFDFVAGQHPLKEVGSVARETQRTTLGPSTRHFGQLRDCILPHPLGVGRRSKPGQRFEYRYTLADGVERTAGQRSKGVRIGVDF